jgi:hypothetical protein
MVHDRIAAGETTVVSTAAVLRCGKQIEKLPHYNFSWTVSLSRDRNGLFIITKMQLTFCNKHSHCRILFVSILLVLATCDHKENSFNKL